MVHLISNGLCSHPQGCAMYHTGASKHFKFAGGYELNPFFKDDIARLRRFSFRFWWLLLMVGGLFLIIHTISPRAFPFVWGMFVCMNTEMKAT